MTVRLSTTPDTADGSPDAVAPTRSRSTGFVLAPDIVGVLVSCLVVVVAFSPVLFFGRTLSMSAWTAGTNGGSPSPGVPAYIDRGDFRWDAGASSWALEPWAEVTHRTYMAGELPLWNPYQGAGSPHAANMQSTVFDPLLLGVNLHPTPLTWDLSIIGAFVLGRLPRTCSVASSGYGWCRRLSPAPPSRSAGGSSCTAITVSLARTCTCQSCSSSSSSCCGHGDSCPSSVSLSPSQATYTSECLRRLPS